jgi:ketosteroid isomerase-like protein
MSRENVEIVMRAFAAFERSDFDAILRMCDEDIVIRQPPELPGAPETQHGHAGVLEAFELWPQQWDDYGIEILDLRDVGDHVVAHTRQWGTGKGSGIKLELPITFVFTIRNGKAVEWRLFAREDEALEAVGLRERDS